MSAKHKNRHRDFPGKRWVNTALRAAHIIALIGVGVPFVGGEPGVHAQGYAFALAGSGITMLVLDAWGTRGYFHELVGQAMLVKLVLVAVFAAMGGDDARLFWLIVLASVFFAHAPGRVRHYRHGLLSRGDSTLPER